MKKEKIYALYKGDDYIDMGTRKYLSELLNVNEQTIYFYSTPTYQNKGGDNRYVVIEVEDD